MRIADTSILEESARRLVFQSKRSAGRYVFAALLAGVAGWFVYGVLQAGATQEAGWRWFGVLYNAVPAALSPSSAS